MKSFQPDFRRYSFLWWLLPIFLFAAIVRPYVYDDVVGEGDLTLVTNGLLLGSRIGFDAASSLHYGLSFSYGYYWFIYTVLPDSLFRHAEDVIMFINESGYVSALATLTFAALLVARLYGAFVAACSIIIFGFSPMFLELATSGHPLLPAAALLFFGGYLLLLGEGLAPMWARVLVTALSGMVIFASLSVRADTALALPWLVFATREWKPDRTMLFNILARGVTVTAAFLVFLYVQRFFVSDTGSTGALGNFLSVFYQIRQVPKGVVALLIASGLITSLCVAAAFLLKSRSLKHAAFLALLLIVPTLVFWLPNPLPSRHFFFAIFGAAVFIGVALLAAGMQKKVLVPVAFAIVLSNQAMAEMVYPTIVANYDWNYPMLGERRSTFHVPLGAFHHNHNANQHLFTALREEGKAVAQLNHPKVIVFGDQITYIMMALLDSAERVEMKENPSPKVSFEIQRGNQRFLFIEKYHFWPEDVAADYVQSHDVGDALIYTQPYTLSKFDKAALPNVVSVKLDRK